MELQHYASPYYDPVKAHEYYEAHKKLKGRTSTKGFSEEQKITARYVKQKLSEERQEKVERSKEETKSDIKAYAHRIQTEIASLKIVLESGSLKDDPEKRYEFRTKIEALKASNAKKREELLAKHGKYASDLKDEYQKKYEDELAKIGKSSTSGKSSSASDSGGFKKTYDDDYDTPSQFTPIKKEQTSTWARQRERRRKEAEEKKKGIHHSESFFEHMGEEYSGIEMGEVLKYTDFNIGLKEFAHSLLENN